MKYRKLREAKKAAKEANVDFTYVCCLLDSLQRVQNILRAGMINEGDLKGLSKVEKSLITILDYVGVDHVISDWDAVKRGEA